MKYNTLFLELKKTFLLDRLSNLVLPFASPRSTSAKHGVYDGTIILQHDKGRPISWNSITGATKSYSNIIDQSCEHPQCPITEEKIHKHSIILPKTHFFEDSFLMINQIHHCTSFDRWSNGVQLWINVK